MDDLNLVHIYTIPDEATAKLLKNLLESNGIKTLIKANPGPHGAFLGNFGGGALANPWLIYVSKEKAKEAKNILSDHLNKNGKRAPYKPSIRVIVFTLFFALFILPVSTVLIYSGRKTVAFLLIFAYIVIFILANRLRRS